MRFVRRVVRGKIHFRWRIAGEGGHELLLQIAALCDA